MGVDEGKQHSDFYQAGIFIGVLLMIISYMSIRRGKFNKYPKGPYSIPILGSVGFFKQYKKKRHRHIDEVRNEYGDIFSVRAGNQLVVFLNGYDVIRDAFVKQADVFSDRPNWLHTLQQGLAYGKGLVWQDAQKSRDLRKFALRSLRGFGVGKATLENRILEEVEALTEVLNGTTEQFHLTTKKLA